MAEAALIIGTVASMAASAMQAFQGYQQGNAAAKEADYNAQILRQQGNQEVNVAASNQAETIRRGQAALGEQAAAAGQAGIGTGGTIEKVEKQSATSVRLDALNVWYGGELQKYQADNAAREQEYQAKVDRSNATASLVGGAFGGLGALGTGIARSKGLSSYGPGTNLLMGGNGYDSMWGNYGLPSY